MKAKKSLNKTKREQTWVDCSTNDSAKWIPNLVIKPIMKLVKSFLCQELSGSEVKITTKQKDKIANQSTYLSIWQSINKSLTNISINQSDNNLINLAINKQKTYMKADYSEIMKRINRMREDFKDDRL